MLSKLAILLSVFSLSAVGMVLSAAPTKPTASADSCCAPCPYCAAVCSGDCDVCSCEGCAAK